MVAPEGRLRDSLSALLATHAHIAVVGEADDELSARTMVTEQSPAVVLLHTDLPGETAWNLLRWIKETQPRIRCLVLAGGLKKQQLARDNRADAVLLNGFSLPALLAAIG